MSDGDHIEEERQGKEEPEAETQPTLESQPPPEGNGNGDGDGVGGETDPEKRIWRTQEFEDIREKGLIIPGAPPGQPDPYQFHEGFHRDPTAERDAIVLENVTKAFGRMVILNGLDVALPEGKISMIMGPSGTGKSVVIKHIVGLLMPDAGDIRVFGASIPNMSDDELFETRRNFGLLFQDGALFGSMNVWDNTAFPLRQHTDKSEEEITEIVDARLDEVGLADAGEKMPNEISGGMRKRAGLARALVLDPAILLFDEPDSGLDPVRTALLCDLIKEIHAEKGGTYVVITHNISAARSTAEYIAILWKGKIVASGTADQMFESENPFIHQFLLGESAGPLRME